MAAANVRARSDAPLINPAADATPCARLPSGQAGYALAAARLRASLPRPVVFTNGVFDLLHAGHVACLEAARACGRSLVVGINSDSSARLLRKGPGRPINPADQRARVLGALAVVDAVVVFDEDKPLALICALRPDVYVKGGDHDPARLAEAALMAEWGGRTQIVPRLDGLSTSQIVERLRRPMRELPVLMTAVTAADAGAPARPDPPAAPSC